VGATGTKRDDSSPGIDTIGAAAELVGWIAINGSAGGAFTIGGIVLGLLGAAFLGTAEELETERSHV